jgi:hypothetical protein
VVTGWAITFDAVPVAGKVVSILDELNGQAQAVITIPNTADGRALVATDHDMTIKFNALTMFLGRMTAPKYSIRSIECLCYDRVYELMGRKVFTPASEYIEVAAGTILNDICATAGVIGNVESAYNLPISVRFNRTQCIDAARYIATCVDGDFWSSGGTTFNVGLRGTSRGAVSVVSWSTRAIDRSMKFNHIYMRGFDWTNLPIFGEASSGAGDRVIAFTDRNGSDVGTLDKSAARKLGELNTDSCGCTVVVPISSGYLIQAGDTVPLSNEILALDGTYRVMRVTQRVNETDLDVDRAMPLLEKVLERHKSYEDYGIYSVEFKSAQKWNSDIRFTVDPVDPTRQILINGPITPSDGHIVFADGTALEIDLTPTQTITIPTGTSAYPRISWVYWRWPLGTLQYDATDLYSDVIGTDRGVVAWLSADGVSNVKIKTLGCSGGEV